MDASEYIDAVTGQMRCKRARSMVAKELADHISDQTEDYLREGMSPDTAAAEAVRQMGDAVSVGMEMDRLHRPRMDKRTIILISIFTLAAMVLQTMMVQALRASGEMTGYAKAVPFQVMLGVMIMVAILYADYTLLGKHPMKIWIPVVLAPLALSMVDISISSKYFIVQGGRVVMYLLLGLLLPAYVGVIYHYRNKRWLGLLYSVLWLLVAALVYMNGMSRVFLGCMGCFAGLLLLSYAVAKGWYGIPKIPAICLLWGGCIGSGAALLFWKCGHREYVAMRLLAFINYPASKSEGGYITYQMREGLSNLKLIQPMKEWLHTWGDVNTPVGPEMSLYMILREWGILPVVLILIGFLVLFLCMAKGVSRQKNVLGSLLGMACILGLAIPSVFHVMNNLTLIPYTDVYIPFLYPGWVANAASYTLLGFYLSVYRNTDVVA